jgi:hypothetical protein
MQEIRTYVEVQHGIGILILIFQKLQCTTTGTWSSHKRSPIWFKGGKCWQIFAYMISHNVHATISSMYFLTWSLQNLRLEITQPTAQEDEVDVDNHDALEEESLRNLLVVDPFFHTVCVLPVRHMFIIQNMKSNLYLCSHQHVSVQ